MRFREAFVAISLFQVNESEVQCPLLYPFTKYRQETLTVEECCKCQSQTKCQRAVAANHLNIGGVQAMMADDGEIDRSEFSHLMSKSYALKLV